MKPRSASEQKPALRVVALRSNLCNRKVASSHPPSCFPPPGPGGGKPSADGQNSRPYHLKESGENIAAHYTFWQDLSDCFWRQLVGLGPGGQP